MSTAPCLRFAPSPTGYLHPGNARTALLNWLFACQHQGKFILRLDDTDSARAKEEYAIAIQQDLDWLGLQNDAVYRQSERGELYQQAAQTLREKTLLYACYETPEELNYRRRRALAEGRPPVYDRAGLHLTHTEKTALEQEGRRPHWRFRLSGESVRFDDMLRGEQRIDSASLSDPVIIREDGQFLYALPSVADDGDMGISHVIRGEDHVTNTAVQIELAKALGLAVPVYGHHSLLVNEAGGGFSKRDGALSLRALREAGAEPMALNNFLAALGAPQNTEPAHTLAELASRLNLPALSRAPARFSETQFFNASASYLHSMELAEAAPSLKTMGVRQEEGFWHAVRGNLTRMEDAKVWEEIIYTPLTLPAPAPEEKDFLATALSLLPEETPASVWDKTTWPHWTSSLAEKSGRKGRALFLPLRLALTGRANGPEMKNLLYLIGRKETVRRLEASGG